MFLKPQRSFAEEPRTTFDSTHFVTSFQPKNVKFPQKVGSDLAYNQHELSTLLDQNRICYFGNLHHQICVLLRPSKGKISFSTANYCLINQ